MFSFRIEVSVLAAKFDIRSVFVTLKPGINLGEVFIERNTTDLASVGQVSFIDKSLAETECGL
jgi:hypothetical protein